MDDVDAFLASLEQFSTPSIEGGIHQLSALSAGAATTATASSATASQQEQQQQQQRAAAQRVNTQDASSSRRKRQRDGDDQPSAPGQHPPQQETLPPFSSSRARARDERRHHHGHHRGENDAAPPPLPQPAADGSNRSSTAGAQSSSAWSCTRCTFLNSPDEGRCAMCEATRPATALTNTTAALAPASLTCPRCTFANPAQSTTCAICEARLPSSTLGANFVAAAAAQGARDAKATNKSTSLSTTHGPSSSGSPVSGAGSSAEFDDDNDNDDQDDDDDDDDDDDSILESEMADTSGDDDDDDSCSSSSTPSRGDRRHTGATGGDHELYRSRELVAFLQQLEAVPFDKLPCAAVPATMREHGELHPFQLQALHWLLSREQQRQLAPAPARAASVVDVDVDGGVRDAGEDPTTDPSPIDSHALHQVRGGVFADYMGLGKTRTLISLCEATRGPHYDRVTGSQIASPATLIVCPTALMAQWANEIRQCVTLPGPGAATGTRPFSPLSSSWSAASAPHATASAPKVLLYYGSRKRRVSLFQLAQEYDYVITSYQTLCHEPPVVDAFNRTPGKVYMIRWKRIILDEAHVIRNMRTVQSRTCLKLTGVYRWVVTATPVHNSINDLYPLLRFLQVPYFGELEWWNREIVGYFNRDPHSPRATTALRMLFAALLLRRTPDSVVNGEPILRMPAKTVTTRVLALSKAESEFYRAVKDNATSKLDEAQSRRGRFDNTQLTTFSTAFTMLMRCRQACLHPYIVVAALRRIKLQQTLEKLGGADVSVGGASTHTPTTTTAPMTVADAQRQAAETAAAKLAEEAAAASALQNAVNHYVDTVLLKKVRPAVKRGDSSFLNDLLNELKQQKLTQRECIICFDTLCRPAILPCAHTFCTECIRHAVQTLHKCPLCTRPTKLGDILEVPEELISPPGSVEPTTTTTTTTTAGAASADKDSQVSLDAAVRAMNVSEDVLRDPSQWPPALSSKTEFLLDAITRRIPSTEKVVVFSHFVTYLLYAQQVLEKSGVRCELYTGALSMRQREKVLERFRGNASNANTNNAEALSTAPDGPRVLLATITTCGVGLNLTCANHCFLMEPTWNPGVEEQALNRVHRIGQTRAVEVTKLIARDTVEEKVEALCQYKKSLSSVCFHGPSGAGGGARIRTEDLLNLFRDPTPEATSSEDDEDAEDSSSDSSSDDLDTTSSESSAEEDDDDDDDDVGDGSGRAPGQRNRHRGGRRGPQRPPRRQCRAPRNGAARAPPHHGHSDQSSYPQEATTTQTAQTRAAPQPSFAPGQPFTAATPSSATRTLSPQQRVMEACQRGLAILNRTMHGEMS